MFILLALLSAIFVSIIILIKSQFIAKKVCRILLKAVSIFLVIISLTVIVVDFASYTKGGIITEEKISIQQGKITRYFKFFSVNDKYWGVGENFTGHIMATAMNPKNMEIRTIPVESVLEYPVAITHLPITNFIIKMEYLTTDRYLENKKYEFHKSGFYMYEYKMIFYVVILNFVLLLIVVFSAIKRKRAIKKERNTLERYE